MVHDMTHEHQQAITGIKRGHQLSITYSDKQIHAIQHKNLGPQGVIRTKDQEIAALQRRYIGHLANKNKNNGRSIIAKSNDPTEYADISTCGQQGYRSYKARVLLARN